MELILLRHANAEEPNLNYYPDDDQRPLTNSGIKQQRLVAKALRKIGLRPDRIISSPRLRARQTAEITAEILDCLAILELNKLLGAHYSTDAVLNLINTFDDQQTIMLVGHQPDLTLIANSLINPNYRTLFNFHKSAILGLTVSNTVLHSKGIINFFYQPHDLIALVS